VSVYPVVLDSFTTKVDNTTTISASHINDLQTQLIAVETELMITTDRAKFLATNSGQDDNVTGDGTVYTLDVDTETLDTGADFAADTFTAPVTGAYLLYANVGLRGMAATNTALELRIVTSNRTYTVMKVNPGAIIYAVEYIILSGCVLADMDAGDTATADIMVSGGAGGKVVDVLITNTRFGGALIL
jgi:hypothetical protein